MCQLVCSQSSFLMSSGCIFPTFLHATFLSFEPPAHLLCMDHAQCGASAMPLQTPGGHLPLFGQGRWGEAISMQAQLLFPPFSFTGRAGTGSVFAEAH